MISALLTAIIGLALQATLGHFFAGITLTFEQRFKVGDDIRVGDHVGLIEPLTWRAILVRTFYGSTLVILVCGRWTLRYSLAIGIWRR